MTARVGAAPVSPPSKEGIKSSIAICQTLRSIGILQLLTLLALTAINFLGCLGVLPANYLNYVPIANLVLLSCYFLLEAKHMVMTRRSDIKILLALGAPVVACFYALNILSITGHIPKLDMVKYVVGIHGTGCFMAGATTFFYHKQLRTWEDYLRDKYPSASRSDIPDAAEPATAARPH